MPLTYSNEDYYFAGLFDGEGSVSVLSGCGSEGPRRTRICVRLSMADRRPIEQLKKRFGGGITVSKRKKPYLDMHSWYAYGANAVEALTLFEALSVCKTAQCTLALRAIELTEMTKTRRKGARIGTQLFTEEELHERIALSTQVKALNKAS